MSTTVPTSEAQTFTITEEIAVHASVDETFQSLIVQMGRLNEAPDGTLIKFTHTLVGPFPEEHRSRLKSGWSALHARVRKAAEAAAQ